MRAELWVGYLLQGCKNEPEGSLQTKIKDCEKKPGIRREFHAQKVCGGLRQDSECVRRRVNVREGE